MKTSKGFSDASDQKKFMKNKTKELEDKFGIYESTMLEKHEK
jgi:hypothetical protein